MTVEDHERPTARQWSKVMEVPMYVDWRQHGFDLEKQTGCEVSCERTEDREAECAPMPCQVRNHFYALSSRMCVRGYQRLESRPSTLRRWIAHHGPVLVNLSIDRAWRHATKNQGRMSQYLGGSVGIEHSACLVGYTPEYFIVQNNWGKGWGDNGVAYAENAYAKAAFGLCYGALI